ncbi:hypothetical protein E2C01_069238 [Portunus trituberculatus]|uniref:Uncharacterized protein n=1 Tax=Portunus trituberculatus TaxID=210409 RepID=A0A5B7HQX7_PORTR|nr:hypothetical protein [Portunus trituberculatus]
MGVSPHVSVNPIIGAATFGDAAAGESPLGLPPHPQRPSYLSRTIAVNGLYGDDRQSELDVAEAMGDEFTAQVSHTLHHADSPQLSTKVG